MFLIETEDEDEKRGYRNFTELLNKLKNNNKITAEEWRTYSKRWKDFPDDRKILIGQVELLDSK